jgi:hypothetical protein
MLIELGKKVLLKFLKYFLKKFAGIKISVYLQPLRDKGIGERK